MSAERKYRKRPVGITAYQMHTASDAGAGVCTGGAGCPSHGPDDSWPHIHTLKSPNGHTWTPGDWVVRGVKGEFYFIKPDIFAETYDLDAPALSEDTLRRVRDEVWRSRSRDQLSSRAAAANASPRGSARAAVIPSATDRGSAGSTSTPMP